MSAKNLIVAFGGASPEHEVSVLSAMQVMSSLEESSYQIIPLYITKSGRWLTGESLKDLSQYKDIKKLEENALSCAFVKDAIGRTLLKEQEKSGLFSKPQSFPVYSLVCAFHGSEGENGSFQGVCEMFNIPYTGSGVLGSSVGMDKVKAKQLCEANDIPVTNSLDFYESDWEQHQNTILDEAKLLGFPLVVKPANLGSSIGVKKVDDRDELIEAVETAFRYDAHLLVEEAIHPLMEINCSVLGTAENCRASVCERPLGITETLSFEDKYQSGGGAEKGMASADRVIPADISSELTEQIRTLAVHTFKTFDAAGVARLDFLVNADTKEVYFNEINTIPGSFSFYLWDKSDLNFTQLMEELIDIGVKRHQAKNGRIRSYDTNLLSEKAAKGIKGLKGIKG
ncbi:MAG: D-alanine--D-alanine ligase [Balneolaceae bacterium]|nr:D-alanine--D-alanine ligase [Balneolaceae bacterium]MBO6545819.1 D-alanine--D-alanine ligase [Balneolaceae bacterium]MBO6647215.1 D-alanine--D-alanine ligase [Balneolaceae bacterium]